MAPTLLTRPHTTHVHTSAGMMRVRSTGQACNVGMQRGRAVWCMCAEPSCHSCSSAAVPVRGLSTLVG